MEEIGDMDAKQIKELLKAVKEEYIPSTGTGKQGRYTDTQRYTVSESTATAKAVILTTKRPMMNQDKPKKKRIHQRAHVERICREECDSKAQRTWDEPYKCTLSAESFAIIATDCY